MKTIVKNNIKIIEPSEGYLLAFKDSYSQKTLTKLRTPITFDETQLIEIRRDNIPSKSLPISYSIMEKWDLAEIKQQIISQTKILLQEFLKENPLLYKGQYYNVSSEAQTHLQLMIQAAKDAKELGTAFNPTWNTVNGIREPYSLEDLQILLINIQNYILPYIIQQQKMEQQIMSIINKEELLTFNIVYEK